jgi:chromosome partitioning protein
VAQAHFRRVLRQNPDLPQGRRKPRAAPSGSRSTRCCACARISPPKAPRPRNTCPYRPEGLPAKIVAVANFKGGVGKTSTCAHLAMSAALDGYKVLVIDLDSQGSMTSIFGGQVADEWQTVFPLLARHYARHLQADNQRRLDRGEAPARWTRR